MIGRNVVNGRRLVTWLMGNGLLRHFDGKWLVGALWISRLVGPLLVGIMVSWINIGEQ